MKKELNFATKLIFPREKFFRRSQSNCHVSVMSASMHSVRTGGKISFVKGSKSLFSFFGIRQCVDIETKCGNRSESSTVENSHYSRKTFCLFDKAWICSLLNCAVHLRTNGICIQPFRFAYAFFIDQFRPHYHIISHFCKNLGNSCTCPKLSPPNIRKIVELTPILY